MYARVVRFTDVSPERIAAIAARIDEADGPPPGVPSTGMKLLYDDMRQGAAVLEQMDSSETPGTRASIDNCEVKIEAEAG